jgi:hypothetical protein
VTTEISDRPIKAVLTEAAKDAFAWLAARLRGSRRVEKTRA